jgi:[acyl-carrier-protein] S-malonyltransferase
MKRILLFPGQGSQYVGMGKKLAESFAPAKALLDRANAVLGFDLADILFNGPEERLTATEVAQPAIFTVSMMAMELVKESGMSFDFVAGHSLGESSALCAAGAMTFEEGLAMVRTRGLLMAKAGELKPGAMCAVVGLEREKLDAVVKEASATGIVVPANYNSLTQIVISGAKESVQAAANLAEAAGAKKAIMLPVSGAFHSPFMEFAVPARRPGQVRFQEPQGPGHRECGRGTDFRSGQVRGIPAAAIDRSGPLGGMHAEGHGPRMHGSPGSGSRQGADGSGARHQPRPQGHPGGKPGRFEEVGKQAA